MRSHRNALRYRARSAIGTSIAVLLVAGCALVATSTRAFGDPCGDDLARVRVLSLAGKTQTFESVAAPQAERPTLILLWSAYDPVSRRAIRELNSLTEGIEVRVVALASLEYREPLASVAEVARRSHVSLPVFVDGRGEAVRAIESCARRSSTMSSVFALTTDDDGWHMTRVVATWNDRSRSRVERWLAGEEANEEKSR